MPCIVQVVEAKLPIGTYITYLLTYQQILHGHRRHDFQLKMHQKAFSDRAPPGTAGGA